MADNTTKTAEEQAATTTTTTIARRPHRDHRPEGVAVPPAPTGRVAELTEAEKTLARQQAVAGHVGDRTPKDITMEKAREISMTDRPDMAQVDAATNPTPDATASESITATKLNT